MTELFDTRDVRDDEGHWDDLAARVAAVAMREANSSGFDWFARSRAGWLTASLLMAAALVLMMLPASRTSQTGRMEWAQALAPTDQVGQAMILEEKPPAIGSLLLRGGGSK